MSTDKKTDELTVVVYSFNRYHTPVKTMKMNKPQSNTTPLINLTKEAKYKRTYTL